MKNNAEKLCEYAFEPVGIEIRTIMINYKDKDGADVHQEFSVIPFGSDNEIIRSMELFCKENGYTLVSVYELLNGHTNDSLTPLSFSEAKKNVKMLYLNYSLLW